MQSSMEKELLLVNKFHLKQSILIRFEKIYKFYYCIKPSLVFNNNKSLCQVVSALHLMWVIANEYNISNSIGLNYCHESLFTYRMWLLEPYYKDHSNDIWAILRVFRHVCSIFLYDLSWPQMTFDSLTIKIAIQFAFKWYT